MVGALQRVMHYSLRLSMVAQHRRELSVDFRQIRTVPRGTTIQGAHLMPDPHQPLTLDLAILAYLRAHPAEHHLYRIGLDGETFIHKTLPPKVIAWLRQTGRITGSEARRLELYARQIAQGE